VPAGAAGEAGREERKKMSNVYCRAMSVLGCQPAALKIRKSCTQDCCDGENCISWFDKQFSRLAAYEDTGKSPEEIISILEDYKDLSEQYANFVREMQPIQEAKEEGRLIVLPRDGQLYYIEEAGSEKWVGNEPIRNIVFKCGHGLALTPYSIQDMGKTVFLTREEAEKALKEVNHEPL